MKKFLAIVLALVMALSLVACGQTNDVEEKPPVEDEPPVVETPVEPEIVTVTVSGYVGDDNGAVVGCTVQLRTSEKSAVTDAKGYFTITEVEAGKYTLVVTDEAGNVLAGCDLVVTVDDTAKEVTLTAVDGGYEATVPADVALELTIALGKDGVATLTYGAVEPVAKPKPEVKPAEPVVKEEEKAEETPTTSTGGHKHRYTTLVSETPADCTNTGTKVTQCRCGKQKTETLPVVPDAHKYDGTECVCGAFFADSNEALKDALKNAASGDTITIKAGTTGISLPNAIPAGVTVDGNGVEVTLPQSEGPYNRINTTGTTFTNVVFTDAVCLTGDADFTNCTFEQGWNIATVNGDVTLTDCTFNGEMHIDSGNGSKVVATNTEFNAGIKANVGTNGTLSFTKCTFNGKTWAASHMVTYNPVTVDDCTFNSDNGQTSNVYLNWGMERDSVTVQSGTVYVSYGTSGDNRIIATVTKDGVGALTANSAAMVTKALGEAKSGDTVTIAAGTTGVSLPNKITEGVTIDGNGVTVTVPASEGFNRLYADGATVKNIVFTDKLWTKGAITYENCTFNGGTTNAEPTEGTTKFVNCTFNEAVHYAPASAGAANVGTFVAESCKFTKALTLQGFANASFKNCAFSGSNWAGTNMILYGPASFDTCTFTKEEGVRLSQGLTAEIITFTNCTTGIQLYPSN